MSRCDAVYVELADRPEFDRLLQCTRTDCPDHPIQLDWIRADPVRLHAYHDQLRRYDLGQRIGIGDQESLL
jgi:hypothetical protein